LLYTIQVHAAAPGLELFTPSFDSHVGHDTLVYNPPDPLAPGDILFTGASLSILPVPEPSGLMLGAVATLAVGLWRAGRRPREYAMAAFVTRAL
jgi:hypothetical protein